LVQLRRGQPGGWWLSFACPKESHQRKGHPASPALRAPLRCSRGRAAATQDDFLRGAQLAHLLYFWIPAWVWMCCATGASCALAQSSPTAPRPCCATRRLRKGGQRHRF